MERTMMPICRSCRAKIDWIRTTDGKYMPVDPDPIDFISLEVGEVLVTENGEVLKATEQTLKDNDEEYGYISHFSTCPDANDWRKKSQISATKDKQQAALKFLKCHKTMVGD